MSAINQRLEELGIELEGTAEPRGNYLNARQSGNLLFVSGSGPWKDGKRVYTGKVGKDLDISEGYEAARLSALNIIAVLKKELTELDRVKQFVKVTGFIASSDDFYEQSKVLNGASDLFVEVFCEKGKHARSAIGTCMLPYNMPVELEVIVEID